MRLYSGPLSMFGAKAEIALGEKGMAFELVMVPFDMKALYTPKHPEVERINPKRQVPVLVDGDLEIFDSTQIFEYLESVRPEPPLWPTEPRARARARLLEHKSDEVYFPHIIRLMGDRRAAGAHDGAARFYDELERRLAASGGEEAWLAGPYGFADIAFYMAQLFGERMGAPLTNAQPRLKAWRERMGGRPAVRRVAGAMARYLLAEGRTLPGFLARLAQV
ncbi:MAG: glutathione S-transferase family protein [Reyranella sp.]|nr:glutathione S-transferase family protein [Reyranella sp.]